MSHQPRFQDFQCFYCLRLLNMCLFILEKRMRNIEGNNIRLSEVNVPNTFKTIQAMRYLCEI